MNCSNGDRLRLTALIMMFLPNAAASAGPTGQNGSIIPMMSSPPNEVTANGPVGSIIAIPRAENLPGHGAPLGKHVTGLEAAE